MDLVVLVVVTLLVYGCPVQAIVAAFGVDERTLVAWPARTGAPCERVDRHLVVPPRELGQAQADEVRVKEQGQRVWLASAIQVPTRCGWAGPSAPSVMAP